MLPGNRPFVVQAGLANGVLGYRGTVVRTTDLDAARMAALGFPSIVRVVGDPHTGNSDLIASLATVPAELLGGVLAPSGSEPATDESTGAPVPDMPSSMAAAAAAGTCSLAHTSWNDFSFWNGDRVNKNNCYNYAANYASNTYFGPGDGRNGKALPGRYIGHPMPYDATDAQFRSAMQSDSWDLTCTGTSLKIFAVTGHFLVNTPSGVRLQWDFHFYRRNLNDANQNRWCHKPGHTPATNKDGSGNYITNPETCNRSGYAHSVGYFFSPPGSRTVTVR
jgi:hypothetical protein